RDRLADQLTAMLQLKEVTEALSRRDREYRDARTEADLLERQIALCESFHRLRTERGSLEVEVRKTEDRVNILRSRPDLLRAELMQRVRGIEQRAARSASDQAALESRLVELAVLGD